jgi:hypothetical protein
MPRKSIRRESDKSKHVTRRAPKKKHRNNRQAADNTPVLGPKDPVISAADEASCDARLRNLPGSSLSRDPDAPVSYRERDIVLGSPGKMPYVGRFWQDKPTGGD